MADRELTFLRADALPGLTLVFAHGTDKDVARHMHASLCFGLVLDGSRTLVLGGVEHQAAAGDVLVLEPGRVHAVRVSAPCSYLMFSLKEEQARRGFACISGAEESVPHYPHPVLRDRELARLLQDLAEALREGEVLEQQSLFWQVMAALARHGNVWESIVHAHSNVIVRVVEICRERLAGQVTLADLASACGMDEWSLCRLCVREAGLPPHALLTHLRLLKARELLSGGASVADAAVACGFFDQSHLHRHFLRQVGMTPGQYASAFR